MSAIVARGLRKRFGDVEAVRGVSLEVAEGEIFGLLGPNGAGKTTTIRMLTTLLRPDGGEVRIAGHDPARDPRAVRRVMGLALQEAGLDDLATGRELLALHGRLQGLPKAESLRRAEELLGRFDLVEAADRRVGGYSGGMRRKLDLASALLHRPKVLFLDEPTVGLDPAARSQLWTIVRRLNREDGTTIFLTTHYMEEAERLAMRLAVVDRGEIVAEGSPASLKAQVASSVVTLAFDADEALTARVAADLAKRPGVKRVLATPEGLAIHLDQEAEDGDALRAAAERAGAKVSATTVADPTLDDLFITTTGRGLRDAGEAPA
ncbi:MAG TPA: ATP-binding cassette domain-containing protein [Candidatus Thermoplasmatota archaeon]|nr:ATP-binding cassette domain-containing protein [Candidatus Thermoplasmatota archaeon]